MVWAGAADDFKLALKAANLDLTGFFKTGLLTFFFCWYKQLQGLFCIGGWGVNKTFHLNLSTKGLWTEHWKVTSVEMWNVQNRFRKSKNKTISFKSNPSFPPDRLTLTTFLTGSGDFFTHPASRCFWRSSNFLSTSSTFHKTKHHADSCRLKKNNVNF